MTIDEVIEREQYSAEANREMADTYHTDENIYLKEEEAFRNREDYHRQLAEWLKELKAYKDFENKGYVMCRFEVAQDDRHRTTKMVLDFSTKELFNNIVEVTANEEK